MVGTEHEQAGMIKHGSKMIQAVSNARVPKISPTSVPARRRNHGTCGWSISRISCLPGPMRVQVSWQGKAPRTLCLRWRVSGLLKRSGGARGDARAASGGHQAPLTHKKTPSTPPAACSITASLIRAIRERSWLSAWKPYWRLVCEKHDRMLSA